MDTYLWKPAFLAVALGALGAVLLAASTQPQAKVPVKVTITVGGRTETLRGAGQCGHDPRASIDGAEVSLWIADYSKDDRFVALRYVRPVGGGKGDQFSLFVSRGTTNHRINTLKSGQPEGSGRSTFQPTAQGGRFEITGRDRTGNALLATIECARFGSIVAEGG